MEQALRGLAQRQEEVRVLAVPVEKAGGQVKAKVWARGQVKAKVWAGDRAKVLAKAEVPVGIKANQPAVVKDRAVVLGIAVVQTIGNNNLFSKESGPRVPGFL